MPFSDFAKDKMVSDAGFAGTGWNLGLDYVTSKGGNFGFCAAAGYSIINFDAEAYESGYEQILDYNGVTTVNAGNYHIIKTVAGITGIFPEFHHIELSLLLQLGLSLSIHPEVTVNNSQFGIINSFNQDPAWAMISNLGAKINYRISDKYGLNLSYCLNFLRPGFDDDIGSHHNFWLPIRYQNINLGFILYL